MKIFKYLNIDKKLLIATLFVVVLEMVGTLLIPTISAMIINNGVLLKDMDYIIKFGIIMFIVAILVGMASLLNGYMAAKLSASLSKNLRNSIYKKSQELSASDFNHFSTGSMITRSSSDVNQIQQAFMMIVQIVIPIPIIAIASVFMTFSINGTLGVMLLIFTAITLIFAYFIVRKTIPIFTQLQRMLDMINNKVRSFLTGVRVIRAFSREEVEEKKVNDGFVDYSKTAIRANRMFALMNSTTFLIMNILIVVILFVGGIEISIGKMAIGDIVSVTEYAILLLFYIVMGQMVMAIVPRAGVSIDRIIEVLEFNPSISDASEPVRVFDDSVSQVAFDNVSFRYADSEVNVLSDISFSANIGETTAIIGGTGSGKSTIASLLLRLHDVTNGSIKIKGQDIRKMTQEDVRDMISYVPQKAALFRGTIADNLRFGNVEASDEVIVSSLEVAQAKDFVSKLPDDFNAPVLQGGSNFSGGQKQRLSIARAVTKKANIYVFDDCFSALDFETESKLRNALKPVTENAAVIIVAQRISTIRNADQIIVVNEGKIVGKGTHTELIETSDIYREIVDSQEKQGGTYHE